MGFVWDVRKFYNWFKITMSVKATRDLFQKSIREVDQKVRFFEFTDWWLPRFPVFIWVRLDK